MRRGVRDGTARRDPNARQQKWHWLPAPGPGDLMLRRACVSPVARVAAACTRSVASFTDSRVRERVAGDKWDAVVVGGGHNGLVTAAYLARAGKRVLVLERRHCVGGAAVSEELEDGFIFSRASYVFSLFRPQIIQELDLKRHGLHGAWSGRRAACL